MTLRRYALTLEYDGAPFVGWQRQDNGLSVQQVLEEAAARLNGGVVPARWQPAARMPASMPRARSRRSRSPPTCRPSGCATRWISTPGRIRSPWCAPPAPEGWSARFSAIRRGYRYRILNRRPRPALELGRVWHVQGRLDAEAMHAAAQALLGRHDFSAFRAAACQAKTAERTLDRLDVSRLGEEVVVAAEARSFLHHQVRNLVGTLVLVGQGRRGPEWPRRVLEGGTAPGRADRAGRGADLRLRALSPEPEWR